MNQVIRIIFDDPITYKWAKLYADILAEELGNYAAIEIYEEEFKDEDDKDGKTKEEKFN